MGQARRKRSVSQSIGGVLFGFEQQVLRNVPPPEELVRHARPDDAVAASDGSRFTIAMPLDVLPNPFEGRDPGVGAAEADEADEADAGAEAETEAPGDGPR